MLTVCLPILELRPEERPRAESFESRQSRRVRSKFPRDTQQRALKINANLYRGKVFNLFLHFLSFVVVVVVAVVVVAGNTTCNVRVRTRPLPTPDSASR